MEAIEQLLIKYFQGKGSAEELAQVENFKKEHPRKFFLLQKLWHHEGTLQVKDFDQEKAWRHLKEHMYVHKKGRQRSLYLAYGIAASLLLIVSILALWFIRPAAEIEQLMATSQESPLELPDGSRVWLQRGARLFYPSQFDYAQREVRLEGEGFFDVEKNPDKPFIVQTGPAQVRVLGTSFNVRQEDKTCTVSVASGKVSVSPDSQEKGQLIRPGQSARVEAGKLVVSKADINFQSWRTGRFVFQDTPLAKALELLNAYYDEALLIQDASNPCRINITFNQESPEQVKESIALICGVTFKN